MTAPSLRVRAAAAGQAARSTVEEITRWARRAVTARSGRPPRPDLTGGTPASHDDLLNALEASLRDATEAAAHSRHLEERARKIIETATDGFVALAFDGTILEWNEGAERVFGIPRHEALGSDAFECLFPPEQRDEHRARLDQLQVTGERRRTGRRLDTVAWRRDRTTFDAELILWTIGDGADRTINAFVHDLSERRRAEEARYRLAAIVDSSDDAIIGKDLDGTILSWNQGAERMFGYSSAEIVGRPVTALVPPERHHEVERVLDMVRRGERVPHHETARCTKYGMPIEVSLTLSAIRDATGAVVGVSSIARDITEQRWLASTLDTTLAALEAALEEAKASEARSRRFLADAAHQLRTPMAGIRACAETLLRGPAPSERDGLLVDIVRETSRASRVMTGLLRMARLDQGGELHLQPCDVQQLCREEAQRVRLLAPHLDIAVETVTLHQRPNLDAGAVQEVVSNLLDNARRHARRRITITLTDWDGAIEVRVADDGPGLAPGLEEQVFERFVSLDNHGGSGLGLPIASGLARAHGGELAYQSGAFVLRLPLTPPSGSDVGATST